MSTELHAIPLTRIDGAPTTLAAFAGHPVLVVNVASKCGLTPQYAALEKLYETYAPRGLVVAGFPANNFAGQEPGTNEEIQNFCSTTYNVSFPLFAKISVKGEDQHPLYQQLTQAQPHAAKPDGSDFKARLEGYGIKIDNDTDVMWNFEKFLLDGQGQVVARFSPDTPPDHPMVTDAIERLLS
jgi:glutathione peroxidase